MPVSNTSNNGRPVASRESVLRHVFCQFPRLRSEKGLKAGHTRRGGTENRLHDLLVAVDDAPFHYDFHKVRVVVFNALVQPGRPPDERLQPGLCG